MIRSSSILGASPANSLSSRRAAARSYEKNVPLAPISHWRTYAYHERAEISVDLPVNDIATPYPLDYRSPQQVADDSSPAPPPPWLEPRL
jgi:hypothetical protein